MTERQPEYKVDGDQLADDAAAQAEQALSLAPAAGALANTESARAIAQVQAAALMARHFPRNVDAAVNTVLDACGRLSLAQKATYVYSRGGEEITGPTIRLAEAVVQSWGNMRMGVRELSRDAEEGVSRCIAFCHDMQTGLEDEREFVVRHWREIRGSKGYRVTSDRDIRELVANYGARFKRAAIQAIVPGWVFEEAIERCERTLHENIRLDEEALASMLERFAEVNVSREHIEARIRRPLEQIEPHQMIALHKVYNSIKGGDSMPSDWFAIAAPVEPGKPGKTLDSIVARGEARVTGQKAKVQRAGTTSAAAQEVERKLIEATNLAELNAASVRIGPLPDMDEKGALYDLWERREQELKAAAKK